jgi:hypothetical protein
MKRNGGTLAAGNAKIYDLLLINSMAARLFFLGSDLTAEITGEQ